MIFRAVGDCSGCAVMGEEGQGSPPASGYLPPEGPEARAFNL
jgi:hypothetical protein